MRPPHCTDRTATEPCPRCAGGVRGHRDPAAERVSGPSVPDCDAGPPSAAEAGGAVRAAHLSPSFRQPLLRPAVTCSVCDHLPAGANPGRSRPRAGWRGPRAALGVGPPASRWPDHGRDRRSRAGGVRPGHHRCHRWLPDDPGRPPTSCRMGQPLRGLLHHAPVAGGVPAPPAVTRAGTAAGRRHVRGRSGGERKLASRSWDPARPVE